MVPGGLAGIAEKGIAGIAGEGFAGSRGRSRFLLIPSTAIPAIPFSTSSRGSQEGLLGSEQKGSQGSQEKESQEAGVAPDSFRSLLLLMTSVFEIGDLPGMKLISCKKHVT